MLAKRLLSAAIGIPLLAVIVWLGNPWFAILIAAAAAIGFYEFYNMAFAGARPILLFGSLVTVSFALSPYFMGDNEVTILVPFLASLVVTAGLLLLYWLFIPRLVLHRIMNQEQHPFRLLRLGIALCCGLFLGSALSFWARLEWFGWQWVIYALFTVFASDTLAYFIGHAWGKTPLIPRVSPRKTVEGALAGLLGAAAASVILSFILAIDLQWGHALWLGLLLSVAAQMGDLGESALKRLCDVKDASALIPGHGGILDRLDSILLSGIIAYYFVSFVVL